VPEVYDLIAAYMSNVDTRDARERFLRDRGPFDAPPGVLAGGPIPAMLPGSAIWYTAAGAGDPSSKRLPLARSKVGGRSNERYDPEYYSREDAFELELTKMAVLLRLSEQVRDEAAREIRADPGSQHEGWAGRITRWLGGAVERFLSHPIEYALEDILSAEYVDSTIVFTYRQKHFPSFEVVSATIGGKLTPALASFEPAEAQAFVARVRELKGQTAH
jgi:hypothetical protein